MSEETAYATYLRLRVDWSNLVNDKREPMRSAHKDALFERLSRLWNRLAPNEKRCAGMHCKLARL